MSVKTCFMFPHAIVENLNILYNPTNFNLVFWNNFQIFLIDISNLEGLHDVSKWISIQDIVNSVAKLILTDNYLLYLDEAGNLYNCSLKLKHSTSKIPKLTFRSTKHNVLCIDWIKQFLYTLKISEDKLCLCVHELNYEVVISKEFVVNGLQIPNSLNCTALVFRCYELNETDYNNLKDIFKKESDVWDNQIFVVMSFNRLTLYGMLVNQKLFTSSLIPTKLMTCPSEINDVSFVKNSLCLTIGLTAGTLINLPLKNNCNTPSVTHLNTAIQKFIASNDIVLYTDGVTMWKSAKTFSEDDIKLQELFVTQVKDFIKFGDKVICMTYFKLVYIFDLEENSSYRLPADYSKYCSAEHLLNNSQYYSRITEELERNDIIIKNIEKEEYNITILALSNRQDILNDLIHYNVTVYDNYHDILIDETDLLLTHNIEEYYNAQSFYFLIKITTTTMPPNCRKILSNILNDLRVHIKISNKKTSTNVSINITEPLKARNILVPYAACMVEQVALDIKLVSKIPGFFDDKQFLWTILHNRRFNFMSEHFIKMDNSQKKITFLKQENVSVETKIYEKAYHDYGQLFKFNQEIKCNSSIHWTFYVKLPDECKELLLNKKYLDEHFNSRRASFLLNQLSSEDFLKSKSNLNYHVGNEQINLKIINDGLSKKVLSISCQNAYIALNVRNFFSNLINNNFENSQSRQPFVSSRILLAKIENVKKAVEKCKIERTSFKDFYRVFEQYQRNVIAEIIEHYEL